MALDKELLQSAISWRLGGRGPLGVQDLVVLHLHRPRRALAPAGPCRHGAGGHRLRVRVWGGGGTQYGEYHGEENQTMEQAEHDSETEHLKHGTLIELFLIRTDLLWRMSDKRERRISHRRGEPGRWWFPR